MVRRWLLVLPAHLDEPTVRRAHLVYDLVIPQSLAVFIILAVGVAALDLMGFERLFLHLGLTVVVVIAVLLLLRRGLVTHAAIVNTSILFAVVTYDALTGGGTAAPVLGVYLYLIIASGVLIGGRAAFVATGLSLLSTLVIMILANRGSLPTILLPNPLRDWITFCLVCALILVVESLSRRSLETALNHAKAELQERAKIERELRESEAALRQFGEGSFDGLNIIDNGKILETNAQLARMFGYTPDELRGKDSLDLVAPELRNRGAEVRATPSIVAELIGYRKNGSRFPIEVRRRPMNYLGKPVHVVAVRDLTAQREEENTRRRAERQYQDLFENVRDVVFVLDPSGILLALNPSFTQATGFAREEWIGRSYLDLLHPDDAVQSRLAFREIANGATLPAAEYRISTAAGGYVIAETSAAARIENSAVTGVIGIARDITERRGLEEQVRRMQRLDGLGALAGGIAHDLNNVLAPILTAAQLLKESSGDPGNAGIVDIVERSARRGRDIVKQVLTFARGQSNEMSELQLRYIIQEVMSILSRTLPKSIELSSVVPRDLRPVNGNATQMQQVLMNLCVNARDAMEAGGTLSVEARNVDGRRADDGTWIPGSFVELTVSDTGPGIPEAIRSQVFEPFFTTKEPGKGTGLGLTTVASIVRDHLGLIRIARTDSSGTAFSVLLPGVPESQISPQSDPATPLPRGNGESILVVDDELSILQICGETLEAYGYRVQTAPSAREAMFLLGNRSGAPINLLLVDVDMPELDGPTFAASALVIVPDLRVLLMSGSLSGKSRAEVANQPLLIKPFTAEQLLRAVDGMLRK